MVLGPYSNLLESTVHDRHVLHEMGIDDITRHLIQEAPTPPPKKKRERERGPSTETPHCVQSSVCQLLGAGKALPRTHSLIIQGLGSLSPKAFICWVVQGVFFAWAHFGSGCLILRDGLWDSSGLQREQASTPQTAVRSPARTPEASKIPRSIPTPSRNKCQIWPK